MELTPEQIEGLAWKKKDDEARCDRIRVKHNMVSIQRQKAMDFVKEKAAKDKEIRDFLNNK